MMLHRGPDRQSAACVIFVSYLWTHLRCEGSEGSERSEDSEGSERSEDSEGGGGGFAADYKKGARLAPQVV